MARYSLVVGIDYKENDSIRTLCDPIDEAAYIHAFLLDHGYDSDFVFGTDATKSAILNRLDLACEKLEPKDTFIFFFIGHGFHTNQRQYILPDNCKLDAPDSKGKRAIPINLIEKKTSIFGLNRVVILDICRGKLDWPCNKNVPIDFLNEKRIRQVAEHASSNAPFGILCCCSKYETSQGSNESKGYFAYSFHKAFQEILKSGYEIVFPNFKHLIQQKVSVMLFRNGSQNCFYIGAPILLYPGDDLFFSRDLSKEEKKTKEEADAKLEEILQDHSSWLQHGASDKDYRRLNWKKLKPIYDTYGNWAGKPDLHYRDLRKADFKDVKLSLENSFRGATLTGASFQLARIDSTNFSECELDHCDFTHVEAQNCQFIHANLTRADFDCTRLLWCKFDDSRAFPGISFQKSRMHEVSFHNASLPVSNFSLCEASNIDFTCARLLGSIFINSQLSDATFTGAILYGTARSDWKIKNVECKYVYWDKDGKERFPPENDFQKDEFTTQYKPYAEFSYTFKEGITPFDLALATHIADKINEADIGYKIKIDNASLRGLNPQLNFIMQSSDEKKDEAKELFQTAYDQKKSSLEQKFQKPENLLPQKTDPRNLTPNQLVAITTAFTQASPEQNSPANVINTLFKLVLEELFQGDDDFIKDLVNKGKKGVALLESKDLSNYRYVAFWGLNRHTNAIPKKESDLIRTLLDNFMKEKCLFVSDLELQELPEDAYLRSAYQCFDNPPTKEAFVGIATIHPGINERLFHSPVYHEVMWMKGKESRTPCYDAFCKALEKVRLSAFTKTLKDISLADLPSAKVNLVCPNGNLIRKRRKKAGPMDELCKIKITTSSRPQKHSLSKTTLIKAGKGEPITMAKLEDIAKVLKIAPSRLLFEDIVPNHERLKELREFCTEEELLEQFATSLDFFNLLEETKVVLADTMRSVHHHYKRLLGSRVGSFAELIDMQGTEALIR